MTIPTYVKQYIGKNDPELKEINLSNLGLYDNDVEELFYLLLLGDNYLCRLTTIRTAGLN